MFVTKKGLVRLIKSIVTKSIVIKGIVTKGIVICLGLALLSACEIKSLSDDDAETTEALPAPIELVVGEGFTNPIGYYESTPRFSWKLPVESASMTQQAYQIQAASNIDLLTSTPDLWDSQKIPTSQTNWVQYEGRPLSSRQTVYWRVRSWDENNQASQWSDAQSIELGLLDNSDWQASWIGHPETSLDKQPLQATLATPQYLRKTFEVNGTVEKARLYISALGLFSPFINGEKVSEEDVMTPGWSPIQMAE